MLKLAERTSPETFASLLKVRPHHLRSVQLERDYSDPAAALHYVVTPFVDTMVRRLAQSFAPSSTARAWRLTGDYGSGKSSFALALARLAAGSAELLPSELQSRLSPIRLEPVLMVGEREPIAQSLLHALRATVVRSLGRMPRPLKAKLEIAAPVSSQAMIAAIDAVTAELRAADKAEGVLIVLDELGKNLEFAAAQSDADDVYLLQQLAETAARSGSTPIVVVAILHQAVASYAAGLPSVHRREWEKVAGRYEEVVFAPPMEQSASLVAAALDVDVHALPPRLASQARSTLRECLDFGWYGAAAGRQWLKEHAPALLPLDPTTLPVLVRILRRFGQNERSLFSFLSSGEPFGLMNHAMQPIGAVTPYRLHNLYDYLAANLASLLDAGPHASRWGMIEELVRAAHAAPAIDGAVLKTVALLNLLDDPHLSATRDAVILCVAGTDKRLRQQAAEALERLTKDMRLLYDRGVAGALCLWPNTSVDLEDAFARAAAATRTAANSIDAVRALLPAEPLVARRHYVETGALRHFEVHYVPADRAKAALADRAAAAGKASDGRITIILSQTERERSAALELVSTMARDLPETVIVGVAQPIGGVAPLLNDVAAWKWVRDNVPELVGDRIARTEVSRQLALAEARLVRALESALDIRGAAAPSIHWVHRANRLYLASGRALIAHLSDLCDGAFKLSPCVRNELINRRTLSSAAARARFLLIERLATGANQPALGLDQGGTPPELAIYLSMLKAGNVHVERDGRWLVQIPAEGEDPLRLRPSLLKIGEVLRAAQDRPVPFGAIADTLRGGQYGIRDGLIPLLVAIYIAANWHRTAVYEDGTYLDQVGGPEFNRIVKEPEHFQLQHCAIEGVRAEVFSRLAAAVGLSIASDAPDLLDVVRPLTTFIARLPDHARRTRQLSPVTVAVRTALLASADPTALVFRDLPQAVGVEAIEAEGRLDDAAVDQFVRAIARVVRDLREAYPALLQRVVSSLGSALDAPHQLAELRPALILRAQRVEAALSEPELKTFALRLADTALDDQSWLESLASLVARKPPVRWADADEIGFYNRLLILARRFLHVEAIQFPGEEEDAGTYRLLVTSARGHEVEQIFRTKAQDLPALASIEQDLRELLMAHGRLGRLAAAKLLLELDASGEEDAQQQPRTVTSKEEKHG